MYASRFFMNIHILILKEVDYVVLTFDHKLPLNIYNQLDNSPDASMNEECRYYPHWGQSSIGDAEHEKIRINHDHLYLTLAGYIRTASISRSGNANLSKVFDWLCDVVYTHQFGSDDQRMEMAQDLLKTVLNDKLSGLYCIDLGTIDELAGRMSITNEELQAVNSSYSIEKCGSYRVRKFGLSKDISMRLTQHKNKKDGYGRWSLNVSLKWMILLSESQLHKAETLLSTLFTADGYSFVHTDEHGKRHDVHVNDGFSEMLRSISSVVNDTSTGSIGSTGSAPSQSLSINYKQ